MVVAPPTRTIWGLDLQHSINDAERVLNDGIGRAANPVTNQFEKPSVNDLLGGKFMPGARRLVWQKQCSGIWVFIGALMDISGIDANVVTAYSGYQSSLCRHSPAFDVRFEKISVVTNELGCTMVALIGKELSRTDQCRYMHRQG